MAPRQLSVSNVADSDVLQAMLLDFSRPSGKWTDRPPLRHYASSRKLVWPSQRDMCSLILSWLGFRVYTFFFGPFASLRSVAALFVLS